MFRYSKRTLVFYVQELVTEFEPDISSISLISLVNHLF